MDPNRPPDPPDYPPEPPPPPPPGEPWYASPEGEGPPPEQGGPAWEFRDQLGMVKAAVTTVREVLFQPEDTFRLAFRTGGLTSPWLYGFLMGIVFGALGVAAVVSTGGNDVEQIKEQMLEIFGEEGQALVDQMDPLLRSAYGWGLYASVFVRAALAPLLIALILHALLAAFGGANEGFEATFRVSAYAFGSIMVIRWIPACGGLVALVWQLVILAIGLAAIHRTETWKTIVTVLISSFFICCCCGPLM